MTAETAAETAVEIDDDAEVVALMRLAVGRNLARAETARRQALDLNAEAEHAETIATTFSNALEILARAEADRQPF